MQLSDLLANPIHAQPSRAEPHRSLPAQAIAKLRAGIGGRVEVPGTDGYDLGRRLHNPKFNKFPLVIAYCTTEQDIALALQVARENAVHFAVRSGGHCITGWSANEGILIDLSGFSHVQVDPVAQRALASSGCQFEKLNAALEVHGLHVPGGTCADVCVGGYMQGGGYGFTARIYGMNCDNVEEFRMMLADGTVVRASASEHTDLFWAVRGGMGGNYGILLDVKYRLVPLEEISAFSIGWWFDTPEGMNNAANALLAMQRDMIRDPSLDRLGFQVAIANQGATADSLRPCVMMKAMYAGTAEEAAQVQRRIERLPGAEVHYSARGPYAELNDGVMRKPHSILPLPIPTMPNESKEARYVASPIPFEAWHAMLQHFRLAPNPMVIYGIEMYGAQIARGPAQPNSFAHRQADLDMFCDVFWFREREREAMEAHLAVWTRLIEPYWNGGVYPNYPSRNLSDYRSAYWLGNFGRLLQVKHKCDPDNRFHFSQSLKPRINDAEAPPKRAHL
jgi:FAD/FMN-containing dehydrogenase